MGKTNEQGGVSGLSNDEIVIVTRQLRAGKSPKEIGYLLNKTQWAIFKLIERNEFLRVIYIESHPARYPHRPFPIKAFVQ